MSAAGGEAGRLAKQTEAGPEELDERMAQVLFALAHPARISILRQAGRPMGLSEIQVMRLDENGRRSALSRQAVKEHVGRLVEAGLLGTVDSADDGRRRVRYVLNQQRVYALAERMREFSRLSGAGDADATLTARQGLNAFDLKSQSLVMVKGPDEGRVFALAPPPEGEREWFIGRQRGVDIQLGHDAFVSGRNTVIRWDGYSYFVRDVQASRNGTRLNFQPVEPGREERLRTGDLVGVGHTILMFRG